MALIKYLAAITSPCATSLQQKSPHPRTGANFAPHMGNDRVELWKSKDDLKSKLRTIATRVLITPRSNHPTTGHTPIRIFSNAFKTHSMALRLGIGDAFTLCKAAVDVCTTLPHQARHEDHSSVVAEMKLMRSHLQSLESQIGDEGSFATRRPDIAPAIKRSLEPLHRDLTELRELVGQHHDYTQRKKSLHVMDQARFLMLYKARLNGFKQNMPAHRESICVMRELIEEESPSERRKSIMRLDHILETYESHLNDQQVREQELAELLENNASEDFVGAGEQAMEKDTGAAHDPACPRFKLDLFNSVPRTGDSSEQLDSWPETNIEQRVGLDREKLGSDVSPLLK